MATLQVVAGWRSATSAHSSGRPSPVWNRPGMVHVAWRDGAGRARTLLLHPTHFLRARRA